MTWDEMDDCMQWAKPCPFPECPNILIRVPLTEKLRFGDVKNNNPNPDRHVIWSEDGLYLEDTQATFSHPKFKDQKSQTW